MTVCFLLDVGTPVIITDTLLSSEGIVSISPENCDFAPNFWPPVALAEPKREGAETSLFVKKGSLVNKFVVTDAGTAIAFAGIGRDIMRFVEEYVKSPLKGEDPESIISTLQKMQAACGVKSISYIAAAPGSDSFSLGATEALYKPFPFRAFTAIGIGKKFATWSLERFRKLIVGTPYARDDLDSGLMFASDYISFINSQILLNHDDYDMDPALRYTFDRRTAWGGFFIGIYFDPTQKVWKSLTGPQVYTRLKLNDENSSSHNLKTVIYTPGEHVGESSRIDVFQEPHNYVQPHASWTVSNPFSDQRAAIKRPAAPTGKLPPSVALQVVMEKQVLLYSISNYQCEGHLSNGEIQYKIADDFLDKIKNSYKTAQ